MSYFVTTELSEFKIIGIDVRTTNQNGQSQKDIGDLWGKFMRENIIQQIPTKVNDDTYCVYTDYENDANGFYTTILGCAVSSLDHIPGGFASKIITASKYRVYKSTGKLPDCVVETWMDIWQLNIERKFSADFDVYGPKSQDPENAEVDTYVSIK
jgi:predicted transcriptional regulator YdeE